MTKDKKNDKVNETEAADTLHPGSRSVSDPRTKMDGLASFMSMMNITPKDDWLKMIDAMRAEWESNKSSITDTSAHNASTIKAKMESITIDAIKEDTATLFNETDLSDEGKEKAITLFEAAVNARVGLKLVELNEAFEQKFEEEIEAITEDLVTKLDTYLDVVTDNWVKENEVAIASAIKAEAVEGLVTGLRALFAEHNIDLPDADAKVLDEKNEKIKKLEDELNSTMSEMVSLKKEKLVAEAETHFETAAEGLALSQKDKFATLVEGIDFTGDVDAYLKKLKIVRESHFKTETTQTIKENLVGLGQEVITEGNDEGKKVISDNPSVNGLANYFDRLAEGIKAKR